MTVSLPAYCRVCCLRPCNLRSVQFVVRFIDIWLGRLNSSTESGCFVLMNIMMEWLGGNIWQIISNQRIPFSADIVFSLWNGFVRSNFGIVFVLGQQQLQSAWTVFDFYNKMRRFRSLHVIPIIWVVIFQ